MPINGKLTYYEVFGLENFEEDPIKIKKAYRAMALKWHPDRHKAEDKKNAEHMFKQISEINLALTKDKQKYDLYLRRKMGLIPEQQHFTVYFTYSSGTASSGWY